MTLILKNMLILAVIFFTNEKARRGKYRFLKCFTVFENKMPNLGCRECEKVMENGLVQLNELGWLG